MQDNVYSVAQVNHYIAGMFADDLLLRKIAIKGEIGTVTYSGKGHIYFSLKDKDSQISGAMWASKRASGLDFKLETGMQVIVRGSIELFERDGKYQIYADKFEQAGIGNIYEQLEALKKKLSEQGMFDEEFKRPIPTHIKTLGVVTAATGAAVRDIIKISKQRDPGIQIVLYPSLVQGDGAPAEIIAGIEALERYGVDVIIVGRGGGSMEDLWCFNDEALAHTIFNCDVPVISAVGHETDFTIADLVADKRAATPSHAAEIAVTDISVDLRRISDADRRLRSLMAGKLLYQKTRLNSYVNRLKSLSPMSVINERRNRLVMAENKLNNEMEKILTFHKNRLSLAAGRLHALSPLNKLGGGYVYASGASGKAVKSVNDVKPGDEITLDLTDGTIGTTVTQIRANTDRD